MPEPVRWTQKLKTIVGSAAFQYSILGVIVAAAVVVGMETYPSLTAKYSAPLRLINQIILYIFVVEAVLKMAQHGRHFYRYFQDPWNLFDFTIVVVCFLPVNASYAAVLRLARVMRALRLMTALPKLQVIVGALIKSIPSMGYVGIILALNFYIYAVVGVFLFRDNDPVHFQDLPTAMLSLFRVVTLEDWTDIMYINMYGVDNYPGLETYQAVNSTGLEPHPETIRSPLVGALFFVTFVMFGTMIMLNLFIGVIISSMDESEAEREREEMAHRRALGMAKTIDDDVMELDHQLDALKEALHVLRVRLESERKLPERRGPSD